MTATGVLVALYNGSTFPCFAVHLAYGDSIAASTGARFGCVAPVTTINVTAIEKSYGALYAPLKDIAVDGSLVNFIVTIKSAQSPRFDTQIGSLLAPGTAQVVFDKM